YCRCMPWETRGLRARRVVISGLLDHRVLSVPDGHLVHVGLRCQRVRGVPLGMRRIRPEYLDAHSSDRSVAADDLVREEPDEGEDEEGDGEEKEGGEEEEETRATQKESTTN